MKIQYVSFDGKVFNSRQACREYENIGRRDLIAKINQYKHSKSTDVSLSKAHADFLFYKGELKKSLDRFDFKVENALALRNLLAKYNDAVIHYRVLFTAYKGLRKTLKSMKRGVEE